VKKMKRRRLREIRWSMRGSKWPRRMMMKTKM
jgi:hypothetical protein